MKTNSLNKQLSALIRKRNAYVEYQKHVEQLVSEKVSFKCSIVYQASDGFCLLNEEMMDVAPLADCLSLIYTYGTLSEDDHKKICI